jgi:hypothetical protein
MIEVYRQHLHEVVAGGVHSGESGQQRVLKRPTLCKHLTRCRMLPRPPILAG